MNNNLTMDKLVSLCKNRGIIFAGSEIYGGMGNTWDYGPIGVEIKNNIKKIWWKKIVQEHNNVYGVDPAILMNPRVWDASGHTSGFSDPKMDCKNCKTRHRADNLIEDYNNKHNIEMNVDAMTNEEMENYIKEHGIKCPKCGNSNFTEIKNFKLMFETHRGVVEGDTDIVYLRPETAQGEYVNFLNVQRSMRAKVPFGIANIGKAFRNEITPGNFIFRTIEFEQMEHQFFCNEKDGMKYYEYYKNFSMEFFKSIGINPNKLRFKDHDKLAFYAKAACDVQYEFPFGWQELNGTHLRGTWDLSRHQEYSGKSMEYLDPFTNEKFIPTVVEHTIGCDRCMLTVLCDAYNEEMLDNGETRVVMKIHPALSAFKLAILPLMKKEHGEKAQNLFNEFSKYFNCDYDDSGSIGKRYRRHDEIGTPFCLTVDDNTLKDNTVTIRFRDSMEQITIKVDEVKDFVLDKIFV
ncbi:MAG: glycine--tRNA ligase [Christensenellales bacterium]